MRFSLYLYSFAIMISLSSCKDPSGKMEEKSESSWKPDVRYIEGTSGLLGEGSIWDHEREVLYWVDIQGKLLHGYDPVHGKHTSLELPSTIGTIVPESHNTVIVALKDGIYRMFLNADSLVFIAKPASLKEEERFNDGKCDPQGRLWVGSMRVKGNPGDSYLYQYDPKEGFSEMIDSVSISNGIIWSQDSKFMYYIDTPTRRIMQYDFDLKSGMISNGKIAVEISDTLGHPDGMTIDEEGKLWVGMWGGHAVCRFDPMNGQLMQRIEVPAKNVTSCAFGGKNLDTLYITTARLGMNEEEKKQYPHAGGLFQVVPGVKGIEANFFKPK
ncbi:MAG: SMP-30/gluconolactonase/LRE family protein [Bacteroidota bacterium]